MLTERSYTSNKANELVNLKEETIKGYINYDRKHWFIFESGFGFWFNSQGSFGIELPSVINKIIDGKKGQLLATKIALEDVLKISGESN